MAITLVTGLPGHGKTLYTLFRWKTEAEKAGRPVFHNNIPGLNILGWQVWDPKNWQQLPANALLIVDEAWRSFPVRGRGEPPEFIGELATHRHLGIDIVLIAQDPMLIDSFVRRLVDRHFHVVRKFGTHFATIHEYANGVKESVSKSRGDSIKHEWRYPKDVFAWYKSAEIHTVKRRIPMRVFVLLALPVLLGVLVWFIYQRMKPEHVQARMDAQMGITTPRGADGSRSPQQPVRSAEAMTPLQYAHAYQPRVEGMPHTAPIYDEVTKPTQAPYPAACLASKVKCGCYSQQATKLDTPDALCRQIAAGGFFIAWSQQVANAVPLQAAQQPAQPGQAMSLTAAPQQVALVEPPRFEPAEPQQQRRRARQ